MAIRLPAADRRRQLLGVAVDVFAERGFHATSMNDVADAAGVTKPVLYQHFSSKRDLYLALLSDVGGRLLGAIRDATTTAAGPRQQVEAGFVAYFRFVEESESAFRLLFGSGARRDEEFGEAVRGIERDISIAIAALIEADVDDRHRETLAHGIVGLGETVGRHWVGRDRDIPVEVLAAQVAELAWSGLRGVRRVDAEAATTADR